jgi:hypothetical protein
VSVARTSRPTAELSNQATLCHDGVNAYRRRVNTCTNPQEQGVTMLLHTVLLQKELADDVSPSRNAIELQTTHTSDVPR